MQVTLIVKGIPCRTQHSMTTTDRPWPRTKHRLLPIRRQLHLSASFNRDGTNSTPTLAIGTSPRTSLGAVPTAPLSTAMTSCIGFILDLSNEALEEPPPASRSSTHSPCPMMLSLRTSPATPSTREASQSSPVLIPGAGSQKWPSTSWCAATELGGSLQARTHRSDQVAPFNPMAERVQKKR